MNMIASEPGRAETAPQPAQSSSPIVISATRSWRDAARLAVADVQETLRLWPLVWTLSLFDIRLRYRGSLLGPLWLTLSTGIMVAAIGFLYARLFHQNVHDYLPYLSVSLVLWNFVGAITAEGSVCFTQAEGMIRSTRLPHSLHAARVLVRNLLVLAHNLIVIAGVFIIFHKVPSLSVFSLLPASVLWCADAFAISLLLGVFGARFRDIPPIVASVMQIAFFITPIMWSPSILMHRGLAFNFLEANPFFSLLEIMRGPLLGQAIEPHMWDMALGYSAGLMLLSAIVFMRSRPRIPYWI